jgi:hypothetical protein
MQRNVHPRAVALRSVLLAMSFTIGAIYFNRRGLYPPQGDAFIYALSTSWLITYGVAIATAVLKVNPKFPLADWERGGTVYDRIGLQTFRWLFLHSPMSWINPNFQLGVSRGDGERLLTEMNLSEWVHWLSLLLSSALAISCLAGGYSMHGYVMLLVRIPFDIYPIMLQRRNRGRVSRVFRRQLRTADE